MKNILIILLLIFFSLADAKSSNKIFIKWDTNKIENKVAIEQIHRKIQAHAAFKWKSLPQWQIVELPPTFPIDQAINYYRKRPGVLVVEKNQKIELIKPDDSFSKNSIKYAKEDSLFNQQWALKNEGQNDGLPGADVKAIEAWNVAKNNKEIIVAVIDTGIDYLHPEFKDQMWHNPGEIADNGIDDDGNGYIDDVIGYNFYDKTNDPMDDHMHGTHCSGVIAASHNKIGIKGIAPHAKLMAVKYLGPWGNGDLETALLAIQYAIDNGAHILSNSWGGPIFSDALKDMVAATEKAGILFIAAAGNGHSNNDNEPTFPANYDFQNVISVAANDNQDTLARFSNWGRSKVHLSAPGKDIISTIPGGQYRTASGTSMATPLVAGAAAVLWANEPELSYQEVKERLIKTVDRTHLIQEKIFGGGRLNLYHALMNWPSHELGPDPKWIEVAHSISTPHNYPNMANLKWTLNHKGAQFIRLHFKKIETEKLMDYVGLRDFQGIMRETLTGNQGELWSVPIPGEQVEISLRSDSVNPFFGFDIDKYAYY